MNSFFNPEKTNLITEGVFARKIFEAEIVTFLSPDVSYVPSSILFLGFYLPPHRPLAKYYASFFYSVCPHQAVCSKNVWSAVTTRICNII